MNSQEQRAYRENLEREVAGKRCKVCHGIPQVAYVDQAFIVRCLCFPASPILYKPESAQAFYRRTGTGDAIAMMQVERQRNKKEREERR